MERKENNTIKEEKGHETNKTYNHERNEKTRNDENKFGYFKRNFI